MPVDEFRWAFFFVKIIFLTAGTFCCAYVVRKYREQKSLHSSEKDGCFFVLKNQTKEIEMKEFNTMTGEEIMNTPLPQTNFVVSELLPTGVHILGGAPKIGKSWLML